MDDQQYLLLSRQAREHHPHPNASGQLLESYRYDLYGTPSYFDSTSQPLNSSTHNLVDLYAGERWIPELGLYDLRNRFMSPELGRFLQADPIGFKGDASNLYRYCHNDPANFTDPMGLVSTDPHLYSPLTSKGGGDWVKDSNGMTAWDFEKRRNQPAGLIMANIEKVDTEKKGLKVRYASSYPAKGPGGKSVVERALQKLKMTQRGRVFYAIDGNVEVRPTDANHRTGIYGDLRNFRLYLNSNDDRFYDSESYRAFSKYRGEIPPATDEGRASVIAHEFGHGLFNTQDENKGGRNVRDNENPVRAELGIPLRRSYGGHQFPTDE